MIELLPAKSLTDDAVEAQFLSYMDHVHELVAAGWIENQNELINILLRLTEEDLALRYFVRRSLQNQTHRVSIGAQSFLLHSGDIFAARLNLWYPKQSNLSDVEQAQADRYFSVDMPHNHNYDFFTVGVLGPGYRTKYVVTDDDPTWDCGDLVSVIDEFELTLSKGKAMLVPKDTHFHNQMSPNSLSVSLNIIPVPTIKTKQYGLSSDMRTVERVFDVTEAMKADPKRLMV